MMMRNRTIGIILLLLTAISVSAQKAERDYIRKGNRAYKDSTYVNAEVNYRKAIDVNPKSAISMYCLLYTSPSPRDSTSSRMPSSA